MGEIFLEGLGRLAARHASVVGDLRGRGLVAGLQMVKPGSTDPDGDLAFAIVERCVQKGLLLFSPVGFGGATVTLAPPLVITPDAIAEGLVALDEAIGESAKAQ
jgi:4-aminobutyrate aminotransferase-like enzyme